MSIKTDDKLKKLTPLQYEVTQRCGTEPPFQNEYWDNKEEGIYVDIVSGEPLFSSKSKYDSGTGWPSFSLPINEEALEKKIDTTLGHARVEVSTKASGSHLGHVFDDGPKPLGKRYCINSASLRFIPKDRLVEEGYGPYLSEFSDDEVAYFAGGCFWCVEADFMNLNGIKNITSGYLGGHVKNPTYEEVCQGTSGHVEAIQIVYNPGIIDYLDLVKIFWLNIDPTVRNKQFCDEGSQYQTAIFYTDALQQQKIEQSVSWLKMHYPHLVVVTKIEPYSVFYPAEMYHQGYCVNEIANYRSYRQACGRDTTLAQIYGEKRKELLDEIVNKK